MRILLRADSSARIGAGHVARMLALAEHATARGWEVAFAGRTDDAALLTDRLAELGLARVAPDPTGFDAVVVDHYGLGELRAAVNAAGAVLVSFEDGRFGRRAADVVVDCAFAPQPRPDDGSPMVLTGVRYAPLRRAVREARRARAAREPGAVPRVLVVLGGGGGGHDTVSALLDAIHRTGRPCAVEAFARGNVAVPRALPGQRFAVSPPGPDLPATLADADLAVSASGVTLLEVCCVGVPAALVCLADNQQAGYRAAVGSGYAVGLGSPGALADAAGTLARLLDDPEGRERMAAAASAAVDGRGADRVLDALAEAVR